MARVILRPRAERDLKDHSAYIAERGGEERAANTLRKIAHAIEARAEHPLMGRSREELRPGLRSFPVGRYVVYYRPIDDGIIVTRILRGERDILTAYEEDEE